MPGPGVAIQIWGDSEQVERMLLSLDTALNPVAIAGFLSSVVDPYLRSQAKSRFETEGDAASGKWAPLSEATQNIREQMGYGAAHPINKREGDLERFITEQEGGVQVNPVGATLTLPGSPASGEMASKLTAAQKGGVGSSGRAFPARPVLALDTQDLVFVLTTLAEHVSRSGGGSGRAQSTGGPGYFDVR